MTKVLGYLQKEIVVNQFSHPNDPKYNISYLWKIQGNLDLVKLSESFRQVLNSHKNYKTIVANGELSVNKKNNIEPKIISFKGRIYN
ncbi:hypothetical protein EFP47_16890 [Lactiplantibacillus pentosus]|uniref:hypothetical protein n=1 Tax=Lactiplantibacillus pentosus TaxID=1589 RepID=UPI0021A5CC9B|nr:hypothetical protein [Lactiplantibacillus pentosus]MCT3311230.1 hypothetical protein [Lactiplantibacillus pentosus]